MSQYSQSTMDFFHSLYAKGGHAWGSQPSDLAVEAASLLKAQGIAGTPRVLDVGCGDGRDTLFFASQGWEVTAVDRFSDAIDSLTRKATSLGLSSRIKTVCGDIKDIPHHENYDLVYSNYTLHFLERDERASLLASLMDRTSEGGIHAMLALRDLNEVVVGSIGDYRYLSSGELAETYKGWEQLDCYEGFYPDHHEGVEPHEHSISSIIAQKCSAAKTFRWSSWRKYVRSALITLGVVALSVILCTLGYSSLNAVSGAIAHVWPGAIFQVTASAALGGWGVVATIVAGMITNAINVKALYAVLMFTPANFVQSFIPAWYYRRVVKQGGWNRRAFRFLPFLMFGVVVPNLCGATLGALAVCSVKGAPFLPIFAKWMIANVPIAVILGWPLFRFLVPVLADEGWTVKGWWK